MHLYLKVILIVLMIFICLLLFFFFLIYNFPYNALIQRANYYLKKEAESSLNVATVKYHFPDKWYVKGLELYLPKGSGRVSLSRIKVQINIFNFSKSKVVSVSANSIKIDGNNLLSANLDRFNLSGSLILHEIKKDPFNSIEDIELSIHNGRVKSIEYSGFKISDFIISNIDIKLLNKDKKFNINKGLINSDVIKGTMKGFISEGYIDLKIHLIPSKDFYVRYPDLKPLLGTIIKQEGITFNLKGNIKSPKMNFIKE